MLSLTVISDLEVRLSLDISERKKLTEGCHLPRLNFSSSREGGLAKCCCNTNQGHKNKNTKHEWSPEVGANMREDRTYHCGKISAARHWECGKAV
jgi:hypothetical protein